jgi:hypothetical protein
MKRSEVVKQLTERFEQMDLNITPGVLAEIAMRIVEDAGMQPPNITLKEMFPDSPLLTAENHYYGVWEEEDLSSYPSMTEDIDDVPLKG